jgi:hypothetical protein
VLGTPPAALTDAEKAGSFDLLVDMPIAWLKYGVLVYFFQ